MRFLVNAPATQNEAAVRGYLYRTAETLVVDRWRQRERESRRNLAAAELQQATVKPDYSDDINRAFRALKPGGILGVEEHRNNDPNAVPAKGQAYVGEQYAIRLIESAGFKFVAQSNINRNPKDTKDYPKGVWTLPPNYAEGNKDRAKYAAIGESDRFTLKFVKPAQ